MKHRWVLAAPPPLDGKSCDEIRIGFIGDLRIARENGRCILSVRKWKTVVEDFVFDAIWPATKGKRIRKRRYSWREHRHKLALDVYEGKLEGLLVLEGALLPDWAAGARDVTDDPLFTNDSLALHGAKTIRRKLSE
ncbi:MAG TPA: hypothetical protein VJ901_08290 [Thermoanaerobaculia bacterium]|nr:hypothetical protein [Thermoanaerobaculia bacterium]